MKKFTALLINTVMPAQAGIQFLQGWNWIPAFAGMTSNFKLSHYQFFSWRDMDSRLRGNDVNIFMEYLEYPA